MLSEHWPSTIVQEMARCLPAGWELRRKGSSSKGARVLLQLRGPGRVGAQIAVIPCKRVIPRELPNTIEAARDGRPILLIAPYFSPRARELIVAARANYADATGNFHLALSEPPVFLQKQGAARNPNRVRRPLKTLKGDAAGRVVRALCDFLPPYGVRELAAAAETPLGTVARVVGLVDDEGFIQRDNKKRIIDVDWAGLLRRWSQDYDVKQTNQMRTYLEPRGISVLLEKLRTYKKEYAVTGSLAAPPLAPVRLAALYTTDVLAAARDLELEPVDTGANTWLLEPYDDVVFQRTKTTAEGVVITANSQVVVDLLTGPGRSPQEAENLLKKMKDDEDAWRQKL